ncbi:MAG: helix-turn-helix transcriptional regulator [Butyrivibrio sp.]|nr:helix-turn-helix transcriptional regulator [Acetatifactor muris]MCM1560929.1 helix-turn-helix transcriptional regulator [Butyrivibrio sp.]
MFDTKGMRQRIESSGIKQKVIAKKAGIPEPTLSLILRGKRKCEVGEYASICAVLDVGIGEFLKQREPT